MKTIHSLQIQVNAVCKLILLLLFSYFRKKSIKTLYLKKNYNL